MRTVRPLEPGDVGAAATLLASGAAHGPGASLRSARHLLRRSEHRRRTVALVSTGSGEIDGVCVIAATPMALLRSTGRRLWPFGLAGHGLTPSDLEALRGRGSSTDTGLLVLGASRSEGTSPPVDLLLTAALAEASDQDISIVLAPGPDSLGVLGHAGFVVDGAISSRMYVWR